MTLDLTLEEAAALRDLLDAHLKEMSGQISHTDNPQFRTGLRETRELIREVRSKLAG
ncbi:MAG: hypothetical protein ABR549_08370 [Mycobacteriales bacterium]